MRFHIVRDPQHYMNEFFYRADEGLGGFILER